MTQQDRLVMRSFSILALAVLILFCGNTTSAQSRSSSEPRAKANSDEMSLEEKVVRLAYMKLELYNRANNIDRDRKRESTHRSSDDLSFRIDILKKGRINEILDLPFSDLVTKPVGEVVQIGQITSNESSNNVPQGETFGYSARWSNGPNPVEDWNTPFREALRLLGGLPPNMSTYITYEVEVSLEGKSRRYRSVTLFATGFEDGDPSTTFFFDLVSGLANRVAQALYQTGTPIGANHSQKAVAKKGIAGLNVASGQSDSDASPISCFESFKCCWRPGFKYSGFNYPACETGPSRGNDEGSLLDNQHSFAPTYVDVAASCEPEPVGCRFARYQRSNETSGADHSSHLWGSHSVKVRSTGFCQITPQCNVECGHDPAEIHSQDRGIPSLSCHISFQSSIGQPTNTLYDPSKPARCSQQSSVTWWACTMCLCGTPIFPNIPWESRELWTLAHNDEYTCGEQ